MKLVGPIQRCNAFVSGFSLKLPLIPYWQPLCSSGFLASASRASFSRTANCRASQHISFGRQKKLKSWTPEPLHSFSCPPGKPLKPVRVRNLLLQMPGLLHVIAFPLPLQRRDDGWTSRHAATRRIYRV